LVFSIARLDDGQQPVHVNSQLFAAGSNSIHQATHQAKMVSKIDEPVDVKKVGKMMGHSSTATTER
jgi:hypothetical protein